MALHRRDKHCSSRILIEAGDAYIELIEEFPCDNKEQLNKREGELIREMECVNQRIAGRTKKQWVEANKEEQIAYHKAYRVANKEDETARNKAYREANIEAIRARNSARMRANRALKKTPVPSVE
jgi:hypothetical protein